MKWKATLKRGEVYKHLASRTTFIKDVPVIVGEDVKEHLETVAVEMISDTRNGKQTSVPMAKFEFVEHGADDEDDLGARTAATQKSATGGRARSRSQ